MDETGPPQPEVEDAVAPPPLEPFRVDLQRVVIVGTALWVVCLAVTIGVPAMHRGDRSWWPWACLAGALLGAAGLVYLRRGRGNAAGQ